MLDNLFNFSVNRLQFVLYNILLFVITVIFSSLFEDLITLFTITYCLIFFLLCIKRLQDIKISLWWVLLFFVPIVNFGFLIYLLFKPEGGYSTSYNFKRSSIPEEVLSEKYDEVISEFVNGDYSSHFSTNILLKKGENLVFDIPGISYCEQRSVKFKGNTQGFSVRLMKGVSYRFGQFEGGTEQRVVELDSGNLTLTNKRLIFSGSTKSIEYPISKIVSVNPLNNGVMINRSGKTKMEYFLNTTNLSFSLKISPDINDTFEEETIKYKLTGYEFKELIQKILSV